MPVTIYDIAQLANVSVTTISKILNHKDDDISCETRQRVLKIIQETNYKPNGLARSLVTKKTNVIGLLIPDISNQYFAEIARGAEDGANALGYNVIFCNTDENQKKEMEYLNFLKEKGVDGVIVAPISDFESVFTKDFDYDKPFVVIDRIYENKCKKLFQVCFDNVRGGYLAIKHLTDRGHKRIGVITGCVKNRVSIDRLEGCRRALEEAGIPFDASLVYEGNFRYENGYDGTLALLEQNITAIFAMNDLMAIGAYKAIYSKGLSIPRDISVVGYDNIMLTGIMSPALTTVQQPIADMGKTAAELLISRIRKEEGTSDIQFEAKLVERQSVRAI